MSLADLRKEYRQRSLDVADVSADPFRQFQAWFDEAVAAQLPESNAMTLATATCDGLPSARVVLLKGFDALGFVFYTNCTSRKAGELDENPHAALVFYWAELERQVRIEGGVTAVTPEEADGYFASRPRGSQLGAWASPQSQVIAGRAVLEQRLAELTVRHEGVAVPRPPHWGGYRVSPTMFEFWQGRPSRLHDRLCYRMQSDSAWQIERLAP